MLIRSTSLLAWLLALVACGGVTVDEADKDAGDVANFRCIETADTIATCTDAGAPTAWTAPEKCTAARDLGRGGGGHDLPQKREAAGLVQRANVDCCRHHRASGGAVALCCDDRAPCPE
jgi:hypothetical protein